MSREIARTPIPARSPLDVFAGEWSGEGQAYDSPFTPAAKVTTTDTYEWLPGKLFLIHRLEGRMGENDIACIEIISSVASNQSYSVYSFYNDGNKNEWQLSEHDGTWSLMGTWKGDGERLKVHCTIVFNDIADTMTEKWEHASNDLTWQLFWETTLSRNKTSNRREKSSV